MASVADSARNIGEREAERCRFRSQQEAMRSRDTDDRRLDIAVLWERIGSHQDCWPTPPLRWPFRRRCWGGTARPPARLGVRRRGLDSLTALPPIAPLPSQACGRPWTSSSCRWRDRNPAGTRSSEVFLSRFDYPHSELCSSSRVRKKRAGSRRGVRAHRSVARAAERWTPAFVQRKHWVLSACSGFEQGSAAPSAPN